MKLEREALDEELKQLKEDIKMETLSQSESDKLSKQEMALKDEEIERLKLELEALSMENQSLQSSVYDNTEHHEYEEMLSLLIVEYLSLREYLKPKIPSPN